MRRSALTGASLARGEVLLLDTVGELATLYARADVAFVGGSLVPIGGHNILEPVFAGRFDIGQKWNGSTEPGHS